MSNRRVAALAGVIACAACTVTTEQPELWGRDVSLTILHTSDIHSRILPFDFQPLKTDQDLGLLAAAPPYGGAARLAALIERERSHAERTLHLDSGDCFQGAPIFNGYNGEVEIRLLSQLRADAVVVGNHEFDAGTRNFADQFKAWGTYPLLSANYDWYDWRDPRFTELGRMTQPFTVVNADGIRVGVIGLANISSLNSIGDDGNSLTVAPLEQNETARAYIELLSHSVDLIGVVSHLGLHEDQELLTGYEAVYRKDEIEPYLTRKRDPWVIREELTDGKVLVFIPGVRNLDFIAGGHLHVVTNPPPLIRDVDGRKVVLFHSGAFAKYLGRLDLVVRMPPPPDEQTDEERYRGAEIVANDYYAFPLDAVWCFDHRATPQLQPNAQREDVDAFIKEHRTTCAKQEHAGTLRLLDEYSLGLKDKFDLSRIFAYAPREVLRRNSSTGGDAPLGNMTAEAMRVRRRVEAEFAVTNTLGIRDSLYRGPISTESMFNVFPFENTITTLYLSGDEIHELLDFVASRSSGRGCQSQAQIAGIRFTMDCGQVNRNREEIACTEARTCADHFPGAGAEWQCREGKCWAPTARDITLDGEPVAATGSYKLATNNYIAKGGSGFSVLKRNTTQHDTGISLRDALIEYMQRRFCSCNELAAPNSTARCWTQFEVVDGVELPIVDPLALGFCAEAKAFVELAKGATDEAGRKALLAIGAPRVFAGRCDCNDILGRDDEEMQRACGHVTPELKEFCRSPLDVPIVVGVEDDRIRRRIQ